MLPSCHTPRLGMRSGRISPADHACRDHWSPPLLSRARELQTALKLLRATTLFRHELQLPSPIGKPSTFPTDTHSMPFPFKLPHSTKRTQPPHRRVWKHRTSTKKDTRGTVNDRSTLGTANTCDSFWKHLDNDNDRCNLFCRSKLRKVGATEWKVTKDVDKIVSESLTKEESNSALLQNGGHCQEAKTTMKETKSKQQEHD